MTLKEKLKLALISVEKGWDYGDLRYCDDLYGKEHFADDVWEFVEEIRDIGRTAFKEKYAGELA